MNADTPAENAREGTPGAAGTPRGVEPEGVDVRADGFPDAPRRRRGFGGGGFGGGGGRAGGRKRKRQPDDVMVPEAEFTSYYGHNIVKPAPWSHEIPAYLYLGGLAAGSGLLAAGAALTGRATLRRNARATALVALSGSMYTLIHDLGRPSRFLNMMRVVKPTSPMSMGTWILSAYGGLLGGSVACEVGRAILPERTPLGRLVRAVDTPMALGTAAMSPLLGAYTAVLLANTATPTWHAAYPHMPFVFVGSGLLAAGGAAMVTTPPQEAAPARRAVILGGSFELVVQHLLEDDIGQLAEPLHEGRAGRFMNAAQWLAVGGITAAALFGRNRPVSIAAGLALNAASACLRFGVFEAGIESAKDPKYTVIPQRERLEKRRAAGPDAHGITTA